MTSLLRSLEYYIKKKPVITKISANFIILFTSDVISQYFERKEAEAHKNNKKYNIYRTLRYSSFACLSAPILHAHFSIIIP